MKKLVLFEIYADRHKLISKYVKTFIGQSEEDIRTDALRFARSMCNYYSDTIKFIKVRSLGIS